MMRTLFLLLLAPAVACGQAFIGLGAAVNSTSLLNKNDKDHVNNIYNKLSIRPSVGITIGSFLTEGAGLQSISVGAQYTDVRQNYKIELPNFFLDNSEGRISLQYVRFPLRLDFSLLAHGKFRPIVTIGAYYGVLLSYDHTLHSPDGVLPEDELEYHVSNGEYLNSLEGYSVNPYSGTYESSYFRKSDAGVNGGLLLQYRMADRCLATAGVIASFGLRDVENKENILHTFTLPTGDVFSLDFNPYDYPITRELFTPHHANEQQSRPHTQTFTLGFEAGLTFLLKAPLKSSY